MNAKPNNPKFGIFTRRTLWLTFIGIGVIVGISYATINNRLQDNPLRSQPTYEVQQGPLTISVPVAGTIQARNTEIIKSELEGSSTILFLVPEGTRVKKDQLIVELDASTLIDQRVEQQIKVQNAEAAWINARENLAIAESQAKSDIDKAQLTFDFAVQDLKKYKEGEYPKLEKEAVSNVSKTKESLELANEKVKWSKILFDEKYLSQSELQTDELSAFRNQIDLETATADLELLKNFTYKRQIAQLESDVTQAEMALERTKRQANANIVQASAELQAKLSEFDQQKNKLTKLEDQISKAKIKAPMDGLVVYATSVQMGRRWGGNDQPLQEGRAIREREELIYLPTTASYKADVKIQESNLDKIKIGLPVRITVDAIPGKTFAGKVATIAPLPNAQNMFMNPDLKVYDSEIYIDGDGDELRSGMGCQAEIIVDYFQDTMYIPIQAVLRIGDKPTVYVAKGNEWDPRTVDLGLDNNRVAQIKSGLKKGEVVWLTPPLSSAEISDEQRFKESGDIPQILQDAKANQEKNPTPQPGQEQPSPAMGNSPQGAGQPGEGRPDFQNMTEEQREQMRQRFQNMTPEEREQMRQRFQGGQPGGGQPGGGQPGFGQPGGGQPGGGQPGVGQPGGGERQGGGNRGDRQNMTPEQREQMRQRFQNMTPEEREQLRQNRGGARPQGDSQSPPPSQGNAGQASGQGGSPGQS